MEELLTGLRLARGAPRRRLELLAQLEAKTGVTCAHLLAHLDKVRVCSCVYTVWCRVI
jgi:hypothetical protein